MWEGGRSLLSLVIGILLAGFGLIPLLNKWGVIGFNIAFLDSITGMIIFYILAAAGLFLIIDGFMEGGFTEPWGMISIVVGFLVLVLGVIPLLNNFGVIGFSIPFLTITVYRIIFAIEGVIAIIGAWAQY